MLLGLNRNRKSKLITSICSFAYSSRNYCSADTAAGPACRCSSRGAQEGVWRGLSGLLAGAHSAQLRAKGPPAREHSPLPLRSRSPQGGRCCERPAAPGGGRVVSTSAPMNHACEPTCLPSQHHGKPVSSITSEPPLISWLRTDHPTALQPFSCVF